MRRTTALLLASVTTLSACAGQIDATPAGAAAAAAAAATPAAPAPTTVPAGEERPGRRGRSGDPDPVAAAAARQITEEDAEGLVFVREEEKLARDVYLAMFDAWGLQIFGNIAASEERHTGSVLALIDAYGLGDPVIDDTPGVFTNPELDALYDDLVAAGSASPVDALMVGALIEDMDVADLRSRLGATGDPAIQRVYSSLLAGSENHLRAFASGLAGRGITYEPTYLSADEVDEIVGADSGTGSGSSGRGRGRRR